MIKVITILLGLIIASNCYATTYIVYGTKVKVYAQSHNGSTANFMESVNAIYNGGKHPWCGNRAYIEFADKELYATALAASISGQTVNFIYEDAASSQYIAGHAGTSCKVISIFQ